MREYRRTPDASHRPALLLLQLGGDARLLQARKVFDEHLAFQVVHFMLYAHRQQAGGFEREGLAVPIQCAHLDPLRGHQ